jgi:hypothetical protein
MVKPRYRRRNRAQHEQSTATINDGNPASKDIHRIVVRLAIRKLMKERSTRCRLIDPEK